MTAKILVVDDEPDLEHLVRQKFRREIREQKFEFFFAQNGVEALQQLQQNPGIDLVLTDINMPEMDGLTLLTKLKELQNPLLRSVIVSAYGDMENIRTAMNRGAFDFVIKPIDLGDLEITIHKSLDDLFKLKEAIQSRDELLTLQHELDIARTIQMSLLPKKFPEHPDFDIYAEMIPAREVGGDFYDFFLIDLDHLGFAIGDVSGKGVPAALFMAVSKTVLKSTALKGLAPEACLAQVNRMLHLESIASMFVSIFYGIFNLRTGEVTYCNGGHLPPFKIDQNGQPTAIETTGNLALGVMANATYGTKTVQLLPGEGLFLYTDGITEACGANQEEFGEDRLAHSLQQPVQSAAALTEAVHTAVRQFSTGLPQTDDLTMLVLWHRK